MLLQITWVVLALPERCSCETWFQFFCFCLTVTTPSFLILKNINMGPTKLCTEVYSENLPRMTLHGIAITTQVWSLHWTLLALYDLWI